MLSVYQHWDPLKVCVVGACWPPEFFSYIDNVYIRNIMEKIAIETQEDLDHYAAWLEDKGVTVLRPDVSGWKDPREQDADGNIRYLSPPVSPRDHHIMLGNKFYCHDSKCRARYGCDVESWPGWPEFYSAIKDPTWPHCPSDKDFDTLPIHIQQECIDLGYKQYRDNEWFDLTEPKKLNWGVYNNIYQFIQSCGNEIVDISQTKFSSLNYAIGSQILRLGHDLVFGTESLDRMTDEENHLADWMCGHQFRKRCILTGGHNDSTFCAVAPGLIVSYYDDTDFDHLQFRKLFPGWEIVYGDDKSTYQQLPNYRQLRWNGNERWLIPGESHNPILKEFIDTYLSHWTGNASETRFFVNILMVDKHTAVVAHEDKKIIEAMERHGVTCHVIPLRHLFFWDAGTHCMTLDLDREGTQQAWFNQ